MDMGDIFDDLGPDSEGARKESIKGARTDLSKKEVLDLVLILVDQMENPEQRAELRHWITTQMGKHNCCHLKIDVKTLFYNKPIPGDDQDQVAPGAGFGFGAPFEFGEEERE